MSCMSKNGKWLALMVAAFALGLAGSVSAANGPNKDHVTGSAKFGFANVWIEAHSDANGQNAHGRVRLEQGGASFIGKVTCLEVSGNRALAGGEITSAANPLLVGTGFLQYTEDNGSPGSSDRSHTIFLPVPPVVCPPIPAAPPAFELVQGNYVVVDN